MAQLVYVTPMSMDGYLARENYGWSAPGEEELNFITDVVRPIGLYLYGRKMYETMFVWDTPEVIGDLTPAMKNYAQVWQATNKIVYSKSLKSVSTNKTRLENDFAIKGVRDLKAKSSRDISIGGPELAGQAIRMGLVDEYHLFVVPQMIGGGIPVLPSDVHIKLELMDERRFGKGWVYLRYRTEVIQ